MPPLLFDPVLQWFQAAYALLEFRNNSPLDSANSAIAH
jgi:hypothetical protein